MKESVGILMHSCVTKSTQSCWAGLMTEGQDWGSGERLIFMVTDGDTGMESPRVTALP